MTEETLGRRLTYGLFYYRHGLWLTLWLFLTSFFYHLFQGSTELGWSNSQYGGVIVFGFLLYWIFRVISRPGGKQALYSSILLTVCYIVYAIIVLLVWREIFIVHGLFPLLILVIVGVVSTYRKSAQHERKADAFKTDLHMPALWPTIPDALISNPPSGWEKRKPTCQVGYKLNGL